MKYSHYLFLHALHFVYAFAQQYSESAEGAIKALQESYNTETGLWKNDKDDLWWQSGNMVETIARFGQQDESFKSTASDIVSGTFDKSPNQQGAKKWLNDYYDDEGWWAMGWIASYDLTGDSKYLEAAKDIFEDMTGGWTTPCKGGIWWDKKKGSIASIANELFLSTAAHLATRVPSNEKEDYVNWAKMEWDWFSGLGVINDQSLVNDGIDTGSCKNNGKTTYTYNQGVVLAGLSELAKASGDNSYNDVRTHQFPYHQKCINVQPARQLHRQRHNFQIDR